MEAISTNPQIDRNGSWLAAALAAVSMLIAIPARAQQPYPLANLNQVTAGSFPYGWTEFNGTSTFAPPTPRTATSCGRATARPPAPSWSRTSTRRLTDSPAPLT